MNQVQHYGTGRRKTAAARVFLRPGTGEVKVNGRPLDDYFPNEVLKMVIKQPLLLTETAEKFDIAVTVLGGGSAGQAGGFNGSFPCMFSPVCGASVGHENAHAIFRHAEGFRQFTSYSKGALGAGPDG